MTTTGLSAEAGVAALQVPLANLRDRKDEAAPTPPALHPKRPEHHVPFCRPALANGITGVTATSLFPGEQPQPGPKSPRDMRQTRAPRTARPRPATPAV